MCIPYIFLSSNVLNMHWWHPIPTLLGSWCSVWNLNTEEKYNDKEHPMIFLLFLFFFFQTFLLFDFSFKHFSYFSFIFSLLFFFFFHFSFLLFLFFYFLLFFLFFIFSSFIFLFFSTFLIFLLFLLFYWGIFRKDTPFFTFFMKLIQFVFILMNFCQSLWGEFFLARTTPNLFSWNGLKFDQDAKTHWHMYKKEHSADLFSFNWLKSPSQST